MNKKQKLNSYLGQLINLQKGYKDEILISTVEEAKLLAEALANEIKRIKEREEYDKAMDKMAKQDLVEKAFSAVDEIARQNLEKDIERVCGKNWEENDIPAYVRKEQEYIADIENQYPERKMEREFEEEAKKII